MKAEKQKPADGAAEIAVRLTETLQRERCIPKFVDSYVVEHARHALQVHAALYRDLLGILQREALLAACVRTLEILYEDPEGTGKAKARPMARKDATIFRRKFLTALTRAQKWNAGDALDFQSDLQLYEDLIARSSNARRSRKPFEAANHPFVDRCAFLLDSSFMEKARLAASRALGDIEELAAHVIAECSDTVRAPSTRRPSVR
jgi:hypothetical protein